MAKRTDERNELNWMIAREIPSLRRYAYTLLRGAEKQDDLVQDTLERAIRKVDTWRREGSIKSWLYRIQYTVFLNKYCGTALRDVAAQDVVDHMAIVPPRQEKAAELNNVLAAMNHIPDRNREVLVLVGVEGFSYDEAAVILDIPVGTVRSRLSRGREELRAETKKAEGQKDDKRKQR